MVAVACSGGRAEPRGPDLLDGGGLWIIVADQFPERWDQQAVLVQEGPSPREVCGELRSNPRSLALALMPGDPCARPEGLHAAS
jgi:hypothetical protein